MPYTPDDSEVERPNYSWQKNSSPRSLSYRRTRPQILNYNSLPEFNVFAYIFEEGFCSPVSSKLTNGARVLYVSCYRTEWVEDMSEKYPNSEFEYIAFGKFSSRPEDLPEKIKFEYWNIQEKLSYPGSKFDFIYVETALFQLRTEEWSIFLLELFRVVKSRGFIELQEPDLWRGNMGPTTEIFITALSYSFRSNGINTKAGRQLADLLKKAGFVDINKCYASMPCGWGPPEGLVFGEHVKAMFEKMSPFLMKSLGWTKERLSEELENVYAEQVEFKTYSNFHKAYAQKP